MQPGFLMRQVGDEEKRGGFSRSCLSDHSSWEAKNPRRGTTKEGISLPFSLSALA